MEWENATIKQLMTIAYHEDCESAYKSAATKEIERRILQREEESA